jgi:hypothetical protein
MKRKIKTTFKKDKFITNPFFVMGFVLFLVGLIGSIFVLQKKTELSQVFTDRAVAIAEFRLDSELKNQFQEFFPQADWEILFSHLSGYTFDIDWEKDILPWIGPKGGFALFPEGNFIIAVKYGNRKKAEKFADIFKISSESFQTKNIGKGEIWTPAFSSDIAVGFYKGYFLFSTSQALLSEQFLNVQKISHNEKYQEIQRDIPYHWVAQLFLDTEKYTEYFSNEAKFSSTKPLWEAFSQSIPGLGMTLKFEDGALNVESKFLTQEGIFSDAEILRDTNQTMPKLAQFTPQDVLFFTNGVDIYQKYLHTKKFLEDFHPQFSVIFDGILRGISRQYFGEKLDFEKDILSRLHGQYAIIWDVKDPTNPFIELGLITGFGGPDMEQNLSELHDIVHVAQSQFSTEKKAVKLPDGTIREELVAKERTNIPIQKKEFEGVTYFTLENSTEEKQFSYAFTEGYLIFSTHENQLWKMISASQGISESLAQNEDFRESILFRYSPSESYGFFNLSKGISVLDFLSHTEENEFTFLFEFLRSGIRNLTFSRKVFPESVFWTGTLFLR